MITEVKCEKVAIEADDVVRVMLSGAGTYTTYRPELEMLISFTVHEADAHKWNVGQRYRIRIEEE